MLDRSNGKLCFLVLILEIRVFVLNFSMTLVYVGYIHEKIMCGILLVFCLYLT